MIGVYPVKSILCLLVPALFGVACGVPEYNFNGTSNAGGTAGLAGSAGTAGSGGEAGESSGGTSGTGGGVGGTAGGGGTGGGTPSNNAFTYEPFAYSTGPLQGNHTGSGWSGDWMTVGDSTTDPVVTDLPPYFVYEGLKGVEDSADHHYVKGTAGTVAGRMLQLAPTAVWGSYLSGGVIGKLGKEVWVSALMRRSATDMSESAIVLHSNVADATSVAAPHVSFGYFGADSEDGGEKYWSLRLGASAARRSPKTITADPALLVVHITFTATTSDVELYVDPALDAEPTTPDVTASTGDAKFGSVALSLGTGAQVDEIRLGPTFASVTPAP